MFSGIIQSTGTVEAADTVASCRVVRITRPQTWKLALGQSISIDGICSTVTKFSSRFFEVEYMKETLARTTAGEFASGTTVNLERSLTLNDYIDGHLVSGHVDARTPVVGVTHNGNTSEYTIELPKSLTDFVVSQGSIAVNGTSLTVVRTASRAFTVALIPHTLSNTNLGLLKVGDHVNIEVDLLARYLVAERSVSGRVSGNAAKRIRKKARRS